MRMAVMVVMVVMVIMVIMMVVMVMRVVIVVVRMIVRMVSRSVEEGRLGHGMAHHSLFLLNRIVLDAPERRRPVAALKRDI